MPNLIGQSFGRYQILEQLGEGGMAIVYKAYDTRLETEVAVKVIRIDNILPSVLDRALKRFEREAKALAKLTHPNIVKVSDYGEYEGKPYLVMPYLPGGTLKLKLGKPIPWQEAIQLLIPIADALDYAHSQNMIHRDVKPSNILLTQRGQPMLTDFGIAKVLDLEETLDLTGTSAAVGTPEYMAPEQATAKVVDHRADIYALGVVLYEMVTGRKPFVADTPLAVLFKHASDPLPRPKQFVPDLPDGVEKVLLKALAKKPEDRYQSMAEMRTAFERVIAGQTKKDVAREKADRHAAVKVKQGIVDKLKTGEPELVEEKLARKTSQVEPKETGSQTVQRNLGRQVTFWVIGFVVILVIGILAFNNRSNSPAFARTATSTLLSEADTVVPANTILPSKPPTRVIIPTASASPVPSAKGTGKIAFVSARDGNEEIYVMNSDGSDQTRLTHSPGDDFAPAWSPDGTKIAFFSEREDGYGLYVMNFDGSEQKPLTTMPPDNNYHSYGTFSWSPDGKKIVFETFDDSLGHLSIISLDTLSQVKLTIAPGEYESEPVWSPDGSKIAFCRKGLFVMDTDGSNEIKVFESCGAGISWSPDSSKILFQHYTGRLLNYRGMNDEVILVEVSSLNSRKITAFSNGDSDPIWSPDGSEIAFLATARGVKQIFLANADGTNVHQLSELKDNRGGPTTLSWSADGKKLAFRYCYRGEQGVLYNIYTIDVESGELANLTVNEQYNDYYNYVVWSP